MNQENLKLILDTLQSIGGSTKEAFIWYLIYLCLEPLLIAAAWCTVITLTLRAVRKLVDAIKEESKAKQILEDIKDVFLAKGWEVPSHKLESMIRKNLKEQITNK